MTLNRQKMRQDETVQRRQIALKCIGICGEVLLLSVPPVSHGDNLVRFGSVGRYPNYLILLMPKGRLELPRA